MKTRFAKATILIILFGVAVMGCRKEEDVNSPIFTSASLNFESTIGIIPVAAGTAMTIKVSFEDEVELDLYDLDVAAEFTPTVGTAFSFSTQGILEGTSDQIQVVVDVPLDAIAGPYKVTIVGVDAAGNASGEIVFSIAISNAQQAVIDVSDPVSGITIEAAWGDVVTIVGDITHTTDLVVVDIVVEPAEQEGGLIAASGPIYDATFMLPGDSDTFWDFEEMANEDASITIPNDAQLGPYHVTISAESSDGNIAVLQIVMTVEW